MAENTPDQYLWEKEFTLARKKYCRQDLEIRNSCDHVLEYSHYIPFLFSEDTPLRCVIYCHGNTGYRADADKAALTLLPSNITMLTLDFSGLGLWDGEYVSFRWQRKDDLKSAVSYLGNMKNISYIGFWGRSTGASTANEFCCHRQIRPVRVPFLHSFKSCFQANKCSESFEKQKQSRTCFLLADCNFCITNSSQFEETSLGIVNKWLAQSNLKHASLWSPFCEQPSYFFGATLLFAPLIALIIMDKKEKGVQFWHNGFSHRVAQLQHGGPSLRLVWDPVIIVDYGYDWVHLVMLRLYRHCLGTSNFGRGRLVMSPISVFEVNLEHLVVATGLCKRGQCG